MYIIRLRFLLFFHRFKKEFPFDGNSKGFMFSNFTQYLIEGRRIRWHLYGKEPFTKGYFCEWFPYAESIHTMVVSTEGLKKLLLKKLEKYHCKIPNIAVIPIE